MYLKKWFFPNVSQGTTIQVMSIHKNCIVAAKDKVSILLLHVMERIGKLNSIIMHVSV